MGNHVNKKTGKLMTILTSNVDAVNSVLTHELASVCESLFSSISAELHSSSLVCATKACSKMC